MQPPKKNPQLEKSEVVESLPLACSDERMAVEFMEKQRWGSTPHCVHCNSKKIYQMVDAKTGQRSSRFLWRCRGCGKQFTVRIGTVFEESRIPLKHWCYAFWRASTSKKGVSALEIKRHTQLSYKSSLFLLHRIRFAMEDGVGMMTGTVEADETYVGGKPRLKGQSKRGRGTNKTPVFGVVQRGGKIHRRVVANVSAATLKGAIRECVAPSARIVTDENPSYRGLVNEFAGGHETVCHSAKEYARGDVNTNTAESSFALIKRGLIGVYHAVSKEHLHRYLAEYDFRWNTRMLNDGQRTSLAIRSAEGKRLTYRSFGTRSSLTRGPSHDKQRA